MTATLTESPVITLDDRAKSLVRFAELAILHDFPDDALPAVVAALASPAINDVDLHFQSLVDAIREQQSFTANPRGYADLHDHATSERALDALDEQLTREVDVCTYSLLSPAPPCATCVRYKPPATWTVSNWPTSPHCDHHGGA